MGKSWRKFCSEGHSSVDEKAKVRRTNGRNEPVELRQARRPVVGKHIKMDQKSNIFTNSI